METLPCASRLPFPVTARAAYTQPVFQTYSIRGQVALLVTSTARFYTAPNQ